MDKLVKDFLSSVSFESLQQYGRMAVAPMVTSPGGSAYLTLVEAYNKNLIVVTEVSEGGSVPDLRVDNRAGLPVLLLDGEELAGAKQNRVLNTTVLLQRKSETIIPVSCTEHGRWSYQSPVFSESGHVMSPHVRSRKVRTVSESLKQSNEFRSDQGAVWDEIERLHQRAGTNSPTGAMRDAHEPHAAELGKHLKAFPISPAQTGVVVFIDGAVVGMDVVSRPEAFAAIGGKLIRSYALEAVVAASTTGKGPKPTIAAAEGFLAVAGEARQKKYKSVGHGQDYRFLLNGLVGSALVYRKQVIHAAFFAVSADQAAGRMMGPGWRSRRGDPDGRNTE